MTIPKELEARIRWLVLEEHWRICEVAAQLGLHHATVLRVVTAAARRLGATDSETDAGRRP